MARGTRTTKQTQGGLRMTAAPIEGGGGGGGSSVIPEGSWIHRLFERSGTPHADDQEFDAALSGNTELTVSGTAVWTQEGSTLSVLVDGQLTTDLAVQLFPLTPTTFPVTIETAVRSAGYSQNSLFQCLGFSDGVTDTANRAMIYPYSQGTGDHRLSFASGTFTTHGTAVFDTTLPRQGNFFYLRVIWTAANTFKMAISPDGITWSGLEYSALTTTLTPTHIFVGASTWAGTKPGIVSFEYLRVTESDLSA